jgi:hypothetical protein
MKISKFILGGISGIFLILLISGCTKEEVIVEEASCALEDMLENVQVAISEEPTEGNNLSFPVIWSDGYEKTLREPPVEGEALLNGEWWYVWGEDPIDPDYPIFSCKPNSIVNTLCVDASDPGDGQSDIYKAYIQKVPSNVWQAANFPATEPLYVDLVDWGDNLESIDWSLRSMVRAELVLYETLETPVLEYAMRHVDGWGENEVHGLQTNLDSSIVYGPGTQATVYSHNARLTIQKLNVDRDSIPENGLTWEPGTGWTSTVANDSLVNAPLMNMAVYEAADGPGYYNAEVNVKGKIIYGYTWNLRQLNEGTGTYRITFSLDSEGGTVALNTFFDEITQVLVAEEEDSEESEDAEGSRGGTGKIDVANNLTYMDIRIVEGHGQGGGGGGGGGHNGGGGQGGGGGGHDDGGDDGHGS